MESDALSILKSAERGERLSNAAAETLFKSAPLTRLGQAADRARWMKKPEPVVTYIVDRNINYTNVCVSGCRFCAFYRTEGAEDAYTMSLEELDRKIEQTVELGGGQILLQGGMYPGRGAMWHAQMLRHIKEKHNIHIHAFSPPEIVHMARTDKTGIERTLAILVDAGLNSIPGGGAEILSDRTRKILSPGKCSADEWIAVMRAAHRLGLRTTATMMFGHVETYAERVESLRRIRDLQDETGGFTAFIPWPLQPDHTAVEDIPKTGAHEYLKTLAISRLFLDNVDNIQASWVTQGPKVAQLALLFGANDMGSTMIEENVVAAAGVSFLLTEEELRGLITGVGLEPVKRNMYYENLETKRR